MITRDFYAHDQSHFLIENVKGSVDAAIATFLVLARVIPKAVQDNLKHVHGINVLLLQSLPLINLLN